MTPATGFLTAEWRNVAILSYAADPALLKSLVPDGLELDLWNGQGLVSVVGLLFERTRLLGIQLPVYRRFEQVNLRFYVRRPVGTGWRRGAVFVREFVPYRSMAAAARVLYRQHYQFAHMRHRIEVETLVLDRQQPNHGNKDSGVQRSPRRQQSTKVEYQWRRSGQWNTLGLRTIGAFSTPEIGSVEEFATDRHWGYADLGGRRYLEFEVRRPTWPVSTGQGWLECDVARVYGKRFESTLAPVPVSSVLATGSTVVLGRPVTMVPRDTR